jgi:hypothetical protein
VYGRASRLHRSDLLAESLPQAGVWAADATGTLACVERRTLITIAASVLLAAICAIATIAVNVSILQRTPTDPIGRTRPITQVSPTSVTTLATP